MLNTKPEITVQIDGNQFKIANGSTVLQACEAAGIYIPRFCYHEKLSIAGNCRMCLVEVEKSLKPQASCAMPAAAGMSIKTKSELVLKAREGVMEFLLLNHPLDCPICDQGGECDLQDQAMVYGNDRGRGIDYKRAVADKDIGPIIKTVMTRCIHCTRCVRFATEIAGVEEFGATGRGGKMEIGTYIERSLTSELSGNMIDLCPVGALTNKPYAFQNRVWDLKKVESVDVFDNLGSNIRLDIYRNEIKRVLPVRNDSLNEDWISDKTRFAYEGLSTNRITQPYARSVYKSSKIISINWQTALNEITLKFKDTNAKDIGFILGPHIDIETFVVLKYLANQFGIPASNIISDFAYQNEAISPDFRASYTNLQGNSAIDNADFCLIIGSNVRFEASLINARIRKNVVSRGLPVHYFGEFSEINYKATQLQSIYLSDIKKLDTALKPLIIIGPAALRTSAYYYNKVLAMFFDRNEKVKPMILHLSTTSINKLDLNVGANLTTSLGDWAKSKRVLYIIGADNIPFRLVSCVNKFIIYQGTNGDYSANRANIIVPTAASTEKVATYSNTFGLVQRTNVALLAPGLAREDWQILSSLTALLDLDTLASKADITKKLYTMAPELVYSAASSANNLNYTAISAPSITLTDADLESDDYKTDIHFTNFGKSELINHKQFYLTDAVCRSSKTLNSASAIISQASK